MSARTLTELRRIARQCCDHETTDALDALVAKLAKQAKRKKRAPSAED